MVLHYDEQDLPGMYLYYVGVSCHITLVEIILTCETSKTQFRGSVLKCWNAMRELCRGEICRAEPPFINHSF